MASGSLPAKRKRQMLKVAFIFVLGSLVWLCLGSIREPIYKGKPASSWLDLETQNGGPSDESVLALKSMGPKAVPFLIRICKNKPSRLAELLARGGSVFMAADRLPSWARRYLPNASKVTKRRNNAIFLVAPMRPDGQ